MPEVRKPTGPGFISFHVLFYYILYAFKQKAATVDEFERAKKQVPTGLTLVAEKGAMKIVQVSNLCRVVANPLKHTHNNGPVFTSRKLLLHTHGAYQIRRKGKNRKKKKKKKRRRSRRNQGGRELRVKY